MAQSRKSSSSGKNTRRIEGTITGCGGLLGRKNTWLVIHLSPWCEAGSPMQKSQLRVTVPVKDKRALDRAIATWDKQTVTLLVECVRKATKNRVEDNVARSPLRRMKQTPALAAATDELAKPVHARSRLLGNLVFDREMGWFDGMRGKGEAAYEVLVMHSDPDNAQMVKKSLERGEKAVRHVEKALPAIRQTIADELLDLYNDGWRREEQSPLSAMAFKRQLQLSSLQVASERVTLHFRCGELFCDHCVEVRLASTLTIREVLIA